MALRRFQVLCLLIAVVAAGLASPRTLVAAAQSPAPLASPSAMATASAGPSPSSPPVATASPIGSPSSVATASPAAAPPSSRATAPPVASPSPRGPAAPVVPGSTSASTGGVVLDGWGGLHPFGALHLNVAGSPYWSGWDIARALQVRGDGSGGWTLDGWGAIHAWGSAPGIATPSFWSGWDIARDLVVLADERSGYVLDGYGGIHSFGAAPTLIGPYWGGQDVARGLVVHTGGGGVPDGGWTLNNDGALTAFGAAPALGGIPRHLSRNAYLKLRQTGGDVYAVGRFGEVVTSSPMTPDWAGWSDWGSWDILRDLVLVSPAGGSAAGPPLSVAAAQAWAALVAQHGGVVLDGWGGIHPFGGFALDTSGAPYWSGWDIARSVVVREDGLGGWLLDGWGGIHAFGAAEPVTTPAFWYGWDIARQIVCVGTDAAGNTDCNRGYLLDGWGDVYPWGGAPALAGAPRWAGWDIARGLAIQRNGGGLPDGGLVLDAWGGLHPFGAWSGPVSGPHYWPGRDLYQRLHEVAGAPYVVGRWEGESPLAGTGLSPFWAGYSDWGAWDIGRDLVLVGNDNPVPTAQPQSSAAAWAFTSHAWVNWISAPVVRQVMPLDCETAALQEALLAKGVSVSQATLFGYEHPDNTVAQWFGGNIARWGDPYANFVGNVYGSESGGTGYGVYAEPIAQVANLYGRPTQSGENMSAATVLNAVADGNPVVIWTSNTFQAVGMRQWTAWDGRGVPYALTEHAITVIGVDAVAGTITVDDVGSGTLKTFSIGQFESFWSSFGNMAVVVQ